MTQPKDIDQPSKREALMSNINAERRSTPSDGDDFSNVRLNLEISKEWRAKLEQVKVQLVKPAKANGSQFIVGITTATKVSTQLAVLALSELTLNDMKSCKHINGMVELLALGIAKLGLDCTSETELERKIKARLKELDE